jgi:hypothetical protein
MRFEKYSNKCINFILENKLLFFKYSKNIALIDNNVMINDLLKTINTTQIIPYKKIYENKILKIHSSNRSLISSLFITMKKNNLLNDWLNKSNESDWSNKSNESDWSNKSNEFDGFNNWYNLNQHQLNFKNLKQYVEKNHETNDIFKIIFETKVNDRIYLHNLLYSNPFVPINVQCEAETNDIEYQIYELNDGSTIYVYNPINYNKNIETIDIKKIATIISFMKNIAKSNITVKLIIFNGLMQKQISNNKVLCPININSGSTIKGNIIMLWRYEEIYKVLIHELIHYFEIDFNQSHSHYHQTYEYLNNTFNLEGNDIMGESYTEILAIIIHSIFISKMTNINVGYLIWLELSFTLFQIAKIINHYKFKKSIHILKKFNDGSNKKIIQTTSVLSYYIIKGSLLFNIETFLNFTNNKPTFTKQIKQYIELVDLGINNPEFYEAIDTYINFIENCKENNTYMLKTLRMTLLQLS